MSCLRGWRTRSGGSRTTPASSGWCSTRQRGSPSRPPWTTPPQPRYVWLSDVYSYPPPCLSIRALCPTWHLRPSPWSETWTRPTRWPSSGPGPPVTRSSWPRTLSSWWLCCRRVTSPRRTSDYSDWGLLLSNCLHLTELGLAKDN